MMDGSAPTTPSEVGKSLAAAKPVSWHGKGDVLQAMGANLERKMASA